jgi:hypothetical protein
VQLVQGNNDVFQKNSWRHGLKSFDNMTILSLQLDIDKDKWSINLAMSGKNEVHKRHMKTPLKGKTNYPLKTS